MGAVGPSVPAKYPEDITVKVTEADDQWIGQFVAWLG